MLATELDELSSYEQNSIRANASASFQGEYTSFHFWKGLGNTVLKLSSEQLHTERQHLSKRIIFSQSR